MGGRLIAFYSDDLASLLLDDFLAEVILDLQKIESKQSKQISTEETEKLVGNILGVINDYQQEEIDIETKYCNKVQFKPQVTIQPPPIHFDLNTDFVEV